jgi:glycosyltransferase involved in cell wall biosynthesis
VLGQSAALRPVEDEAGMAEEIRRLAVDEQYRGRMREKGLENVRSRFQTTRMMDQYVSLYRELACAS